MILDIDSICGAIDNNLAELIHTVIVIIKFGIPLLLIIFGMLDFGKGVIASKDDEIKSGQRMFLKRVISAFLVFFVVTIVQLLIGLVDDKNDSDESDAWNCANLILNGEISNSSGSTSGSNTTTPSNAVRDVTGTTNDGLTCINKTAAAQYDMCFTKNSSANNTNSIVCGTIFNELCNYEGQILWNNSGKYTSDIVDELEWYQDENIETIKQVYYNCVQSGLSKDTCKGFFQGFYAVR